MGYKGHKLVSQALKIGNKGSFLLCSLLVRLVMGVKRDYLFPGTAGEWVDEGSMQGLFYIHIDQLAQAYKQLNISQGGEFWRDVRYLWHFKSFIPFVGFFPPCMLAWSGDSEGVGRRK